MRTSSSTKPDSGVAAATTSDEVTTKDTDSCLALVSAATLLLHLICMDACGPIRFFHVYRPNGVSRNCPSAISEYSEPAFLLITIKPIYCEWPILIPRQILEKGVSQYVGNLVSCVSNPVFPPATTYLRLSLQR